MGKRIGWLVAGLMLALAAACGAREQPSAASPSASDQALGDEIVTVLPKDAIPSIDEPRFYSAEGADAEYDSDEQVIGVEVEGEARAYSTALLSSHEIVNDEIQGRPIAVTW